MINDGLSTSMSDAPPEEVKPLAPEAEEETIIEPRPGWIAIDWREIYRFRELLFFLVWRDVKVRYKQTVLGVAWAVLQPVCAVAIFTIFFGKFAGIEATLPEGMPYAVFAYAGMLSWQFFATGISAGGMSLVNQQGILSKIYLPRLFVPTATIGGALVDMGISFGVFALLLVIYGIVPSWGVIFVPFMVLLTVMAALGVAFMLSALSVTYRDFRFLIPFMVQAWLILSPVIWPVQMVPERWHWLLAFNPMTGIINGYRSAFFGDPWDFGTLGIAIGVTVGMFLLGLFYFRRTERRFADIA